MKLIEYLQQAMACSWRARALIVAGLILAFAIIHLGVGIAIAKRYDQYADVFRQSVALAIYNIVIGVLGLVVVIVSVVACLREDPRLSNYSPFLDGSRDGRFAF